MESNALTQKDIEVLFTQLLRKLAKVSENIDINLRSQILEEFKIYEDNNISNEHVVSYLTSYMIENINVKIKELNDMKDFVNILHKYYLYLRNSKQSNDGN